MSFFESSKERLDWIYTPARATILQAPGCAQCGSRLEMNGPGQYSLSGKCFNCVNRQLEDDEYFGELED